MITKEDAAVEFELEPLCKELRAVLMNKPAQLACPALLSTCVEIMCEAGKVDPAKAFRDLAELCTSLAEEPST